VHSDATNLVLASNVLRYPNNAVTRIVIEHQNKTGGARYFTLRATNPTTSDVTVRLKSYADGELDEQRSALNAYTGFVRNLDANRARDFSIRPGMTVNLNVKNIPNGRTYIALGSVTK
jgi:hypothetical protein